VAIWQAASERLLFFTVSLEQANELGAIFRVTSAFQDPNHLGRHLVLAIGVVLVLAWAARLATGAALALLALLGTGLWFTYSQSSAVALAVVALAVAMVMADGRARRVLATTAAAGAVAAVVAVAALVAAGSADSVTSDRSTLVTDTAAVAAKHPLVGVGVSGQPAATREQEAPEATKLQNVSHTTPLTVAAELGVVGVAAFVALMAGAIRLLVELARSDRALGLGIAAVLLGLLVHSLFYAGLFENPITWGALGVAAAAVARHRRADAGEPPEPLRSWARRGST
jgi:O-antigen ligase